MTFPASRRANWRVSVHGDAKDHNSRVALSETSWETASLWMIWDGMGTRCFSTESPHVFFPTSATNMLAQLNIKTDVRLETSFHVVLLQSSNSGNPQ